MSDSFIEELAKHEELSPHALIARAADALKLPKENLPVLDVEARLRVAQRYLNLYFSIVNQYPVVPL